MASNNKKTPKAARKGKPKWWKDDEKLGRFIEAVERNPVLYDNAEQNYKDTQIKDAVWQTIMDELQFEGTSKFFPSSTYVSIST